MIKRCWLSWLAGLVGGVAAGESSPVDLYEIPLREEMKLIANGAAGIDGASAAFTTTRGAVWILENPRAVGRHGDFHWRKFASGLRRPGRIEVSPDGGFLVWQHSEVTHLIDGNGDGMADQFLRNRDRDGQGDAAEEGLPSPFDGFRSWGRAKQSGQYRGQYFGGELGRASLSRLSIEQDERGAHYTLTSFVRGIRFPIDCMAFLDEDTWLIAQSNRNVHGRSRTRFALHRLNWRDDRPFELISIRIREDGFRLAFSDQLMKNTAQGAWAYRIEEMGVDSRALEIEGVDLSEDERFVTLRTERTVPGRVYRVTFDGVWSIHRDPVRIPMARVAWIKIKD